MERIMRVPKQQNPDQQAPAELDAHVEGTDANCSDAQPPLPYLIKAAPHGGSSNSAIDIVSKPSELRVKDLHVAHFEPNWRRMARNLVISPKATSEVSSAYNLLRTQIVKRLRQNSWNTIAVTSPAGGAGTTLTAINLSISIAREFNRSALLVELNLVNPSFHRIIGFGFGQRVGVVDYLLHDKPLSDILLDIGVEGLLIIPAGLPVSNSSELLSSSKMARFMEDLKTFFENHIVLFDLPPALTVDDALVFASMADCTLMVVEEGETRIDDVRRVLGHFDRTKILGIVLNRSTQSEGGLVSP